MTRTSGDPPPIARVEILWSENSAVPARVFRSLAQADAALARAFTVERPPRGGGYDKTAFKIVWTDGEEHEGRADVREIDVRTAPAAGGILRQHLRTVGTWLRDNANKATWWSHDERFKQWAWGIELLRRLDAEPALDTHVDQPNDDDEDLWPMRNGEDSSASRPTLGASPATTIGALLRGYLDIRGPSPQDRDSIDGAPAVPATTNADVRAVVNQVSLALANDLARVAHERVAHVWNHWRAVHDTIRGLLRTGDDADEYADNRGLWLHQLPTLGALLVDSLDPPRGGGPRNRSRLVFRPVGATSDPYPAWVQALRGQSGVYVIRERQPDGSTPIVYVGQSSKARLYETFTRHFQMWRRSKGFWRGQYAEGHDPGLTYDRGACEATAIATAPGDALELEARLIARLRPRDNLLGQPAEEVPF